MATSKEVRGDSRGPITICLEAAFALVMLSLFSVFVGVLIEIAGSYTFWKKEGIAHAQRIVQQDLRYIQQAPRSIFVSDTQAFATQVLRWVRWPYETFGVIRWYQSAHSSVSVHTNTPNGKKGQQAGQTVKDGVQRASGKTSRLISSIAVTSMFVAQDVALRLAIALFALPAFALACLVGIVDGMVKRDLRRWGGGRESSYIYHHAKRYTKWALTAGFALYLSWPFGGINPTYMVLIFTVLVAFTLSVTVATFKKYV
ncbi:TIGR03747 family integrating conjugative element membrane protein [Lampropedia puyangensis]|uniref:TIGR03747 family integrating conjugative element membrane protein n=1 Tax=Lampropedia puyangensis TaxID=1330072 RepID=A0A4S8EVW2_9BURK|nr:TIGR03747 family integrating conjugative element membrane protein [Lampropedia puyangensis]THT98400.1 TIGR03747 family integrating conjugative element membrane protein [Lampropedia puyangensis]